MIHIRFVSKVSKRHFLRRWVVHVSFYGGASHHCQIAANEWRRNSRSRLTKLIYMLPLRCMRSWWKALCNFDFNILLWQGLLLQYFLIACKNKLMQLPLFCVLYMQTRRVFEALCAALSSIPCDCESCIIMCTHTNTHTHTLPHTFQTSWSTC